jgi:environmental stress-induced protein Ves
LKIIRKHEQKTNLWSGGKTTELFIYPDGSSYAERNFQFRISTATIETATSEFTRLNGFKRHLMILDGSLYINHKHHHQKLLNQFDVDEFMGDWETTAEGKVTDFNLMHDANFKGKIEVLHLEKQLQHTLKLENDFTAFYVLNEFVIIDNHELQKGDFVNIDYKKSLPIYSKENAHLIIIGINSIKL